VGVANRRSAEVFSTQYFNIKQFAKIFSHKLNALCSNNCTKNHLGGGVLSPLSLSAIVVWDKHSIRLSLEVLLSGMAHEDSISRALTPMCRNSPWWWSCERCTNFFVFLLAAISCSTGHYVMYKQLSHQLAYNYTGSLWTRLENELVDVNRVFLVIHLVRVGPATRSAVATCNNNFTVKMTLKSWNQFTKSVVTHRVPTSYPSLLFYCHEQL